MFNSVSINIMSEYISSNLQQGESVLYEAKVSIRSLYPVFALCGIVFIWAVIILGIEALSLFIVLPIIIGFLVLERKNTELVITDRQIICKYGLIRRETAELSLNRIEGIQLNQSITGRILDYGTIVISGVGTQKNVVPNIDKPLEFRRQFNDIRQRLES